MSLDFFADLLITGTVLGLDHTSDLATVEEVLGHDCTYDAPYGRISNYGLIEFGWDVRPVENPPVTYFGVQTHRLPRLVAEGEIDTALVEYYGPFHSQLLFDDVNAAAEKRRFTLEELPPRDDGYIKHQEPTSGMGILWLADPDEADQDRPIGTVEKMLGGRPGNPWPWHRFRNQQKSFASYVDHLLTLSEPGLVAWLDKREPEEHQAEWWIFLRSMVARRTGTERLGFTLDRLAAERGVDPADEAAVMLAVALLKPVGDDLPTIDEAVECWLATIPPLADATRLGTDPEDIRRARRLRNQIHEIQPCLPLLTSAEVADELRAWVDLKPRLLAYRRAT